MQQEPKSDHCEPYTVHGEEWKEKRACNGKNAIEATLHHGGGKKKGLLQIQFPSLWQVYCPVKKQPHEQPSHCY
jgi:hypothetical protein